MATTVIRNVLHAYDFTPSDRPADPAGEETEYPTLVFIHGWLLSRAYWQPLIDLLKQDYACLAYDLRGFGESARRPKAIATQTKATLSKITAPISNIYSTPSTSKTFGLWVIP